MGNRGSGPLHHPENGEEIDRVSDRATALINKANEAKGRLLIPAIVLTEYLLGIDRNHFNEHVAELSASAAIEILPFDETAAIECALIVEGDELQQMAQHEVKSKMRADRQVLATALAAGVDELWTHDQNLYRKAKSLGVSVGCLGDIDIQMAQREINYENPQHHGGS